LGVASLHPDSPQVTLGFRKWGDKNDLRRRGITLMSTRKRNRRQFLQSAAHGTAALAAASVTPYWLTASVAKAQEESKNDRHVIPCIGTGDRWNGAIGPQIKRHGDIVAVCDVDQGHLEGNGLRVAPKAQTYSDYRRVLDRNDIDIVTIVTPDHWHSKI